MKKNCFIRATKNYGSKFKVMHHKNEEMRKKSRKYKILQLWIITALKTNSSQSQYSHLKSLKMTDKND